MPTEKSEVNPSLLEYVAEGDPRNPTIYFIHGWPDDLDLFREHSASLSRQGYYCVRIGLPGFQKGSAGPKDWPQWGEPLHSVALRIERTISYLNSLKSTTLTAGPFLVGHDWGAIFAYDLLEHYPTIVKKVIMLDIGGISGKWSPMQLLFVLAYQYVNIVSWLLPAFLGNILLRGMCNAFKGRPQYGQVIRTTMCYPYFYLWRGILLRRPLAHMSHFVVRCPTYYLYGAKKALHFHTPKFLELLAARKDCRVQAVYENGGQHWFFFGNDVLQKAVLEFFV